MPTERNNRDPNVDNVIQRGLITSAAFFDEFQRELVRHLVQSKSDGATIAELLDDARDILRSYADPMTMMMADANLVAYFQGAADVAQELPATETLTVGPEPAPHLPLDPGHFQWQGMDVWLPLISGAIEDLQSRKLMTKRQFDRLDKKARKSAFTVANISSRKTIRRIRDAVMESVAKGSDLRTFQHEMEEALETSPLGQAHLENVFRTNVASAYMAGMDKIHEHPMVADEFPYVENLPIRDSRLTDLCSIISHSGIQGTAIYRADDPVWLKFKNPRHYQCRCGRRLLSVKDAADREIVEAQNWHRTGKPPTKPKHVKHPNAELPKGWEAPVDLSVREIDMAWEQFQTKRMKSPGVHDRETGEKLYGKAARDAWEHQDGKTKETQSRMDRQVERQRLAKLESDTKVGDTLVYTGKTGSSPAEFRGFHYDTNTGEKLARIIVRPQPGESGAPFEASVRLSELSTPQQSLQSQPAAETKAKEPHEMTREEWEKSAIQPEEASKILSKIRGGDTRSKHKGSDSGDEYIKNPMVKTVMPLSLFDEDFREFLKDTTNQKRVDDYASQNIDTPIFALRGKDTPHTGYGWYLSDGGHRLAAAIKRGDKYINAYVPADTHKRFVEHSLAAGKTVPSEVLADYPDLAAKYRKSTELSMYSNPNRLSHVLTLLDDVGIRLPHNTNEVNLFQRLRVALIACRHVLDMSWQPFKTERMKLQGAFDSDNPKKKLYGKSAKLALERQEKAKNKKPTNKPGDKRAKPKQEPERGTGTVPRGAMGGGAGGTRRKPITNKLVTARDFGNSLDKKAVAKLVPKRLQKFLSITNADGSVSDHQMLGAATAIKALQTSGGFLMADGAGSGKTREILATAQAFADKGKKVLIVSQAGIIKPDWKNNLVSGSVGKDAAAMGINLQLNRGKDKLKSGEIHVSTYESLQGFLDKIDKDTVVLYDEAHTIKNVKSARGKYGLEISQKAGASLFATATPADRVKELAYLFRAHIEPPPWKETLKELSSKKNDAMDVIRKTEEVFDTLTRKGLMIKREISLDNVEVHFDHIKLPQAAHDEMEKIAAEAEGGKPFAKAQMLMKQRYAQERHKIPHTVKAIHEEMKQGRQCVVFTAGVHTGGGAGMIKELRKALIASGINDEDIGELHGGVSDGKEAVAGFQSGKYKVLITTPQSGSTGHNLDDVVGNRPRSQIVMTPPFSASINSQMWGRTHRLSTKSKSRMRYLFGDTDVERWNADLIRNKVEFLGAVVGGEAKRQNIPAL